MATAAEGETTVARKPSLIACADSPPISSDARRRRLPTDKTGVIRGGNAAMCSKRQAQAAIRGHRPLLTLKSQVFALLPSRSMMP
jgi:hypothetical protein